MARGLERIPLAVSPDFQMSPVRAEFPDISTDTPRIVGFEPFQPAEANAPPAAPATRSAGDVVADTGYGLAKGAGQLVKGLGWLARNERLQQIGQDAEDYWGEKQSAELRRQLDGVGKAEGVMGTIAALWDNPGAIGDYVATSLPQMVPGLGVGAVGARGIVAFAGTSARQAALRAGASEAAAMQAGRVAAERAAEKAATRFAVGANMVGEGVTTAGQSGAEVEQFAREHGATAEQAREAANEAAVKAGIWTTLGAGIGAGMETRALLGRLKDKGIAGAAKNIGKEALEEAVQNPGQDYAEYEGKARFDPTQTFDPGKSATLGAITGGVMGAGFHAAGRAAERLSGEPNTAAANGGGDAGAPPLEGDVLPRPPRPGLPNADLRGKTYDQAVPLLPGEGAAAEGEVLGPEALPAGQPLLPPPAIDGEARTVPPDPNQQALPAPSLRQAAMARGLLTHSRRPSPELLQRLMAVDASTAAQLYAQWQQSQGWQRGQSADGQDAQIPAARDAGGRDLATGSRVVGGDTRAEQPRGIDRPADMPQRGSESPLAVGDGGTATPITALDVHAHAAATSPFNAAPQPTDAQKEAGNYRKGHVRFQGMDISIENPAGSLRSGTDADGKPWQTEMQHHYGYIRGTVGRDKDHLDVFIKPQAKTARTAYVIDQTDPKTGRFDEHKIILGADSEADAKAVYQANYDQGWQGLGAITAMPMADFKAWLKGGKTKRPLAYVEPKEVRAQPRRAPKADTLLQAIVNRGGISRSIMQDVGADPRGRYMPGLFTQNGTEDLSSLAQALFDEDGFHQIRQDTDIGPARELEDLLTRALGGEKVLSTSALERGQQAQQNAELRDKAKRLGVKTVARSLTDIAAEVAAIEVRSLADAETQLEDEALVAYNELVDAMRAAVGDEDAEALLEELATRHQDATHLHYLRQATVELQEKLREQAVRDAGEREEAAAGAARKAHEDSSQARSPGTASQEARPAAAGADAAPDFALEGQTEAEIAAREQEQRAADTQREVEQQAVERKRQADAERDTFTLTGSDRPADVLAAQGQGGLFDAPTPSAADTIAGKPVSEISDKTLEQIAGSSQPAAVKAKAEVARRKARSDTADHAPAIDTSAKPVEESAKSEQVAMPTGPYTLDEHRALMDKLNAGMATVEEYKAAFERLRAAKEVLTAEFQKMTKEQIMQSARLPSHWKNDAKDKLVRAAVNDLASDFDLRETMSYVLGERENTLLRVVNDATQETLDAYAARRKAKIAEYMAERQQRAEGIDNPQTLQDFRNFIAAKKSEGASFAEARMMLTPEQRERFDELTAEDSRAERARTAPKPAEVTAAVTTTSGDIIETKHTKTGEPLFVVKAAERVERDVYNQWNATAKKLGGWYSSYRGGGAVPGFQFKTRENADAFLKFLGGDVDQAKEQAQARRDAYADDKAQSTVERLREMAGAKDEAADAALNQERKINTARRARFAAAAEAAANQAKATAKTMLNLAQAMEDGKVKFLDRVRQKVQIEMLNQFVANAKRAELQAKYPTWHEQEKHAGERPTPETADYAEYPQYTAFRSDLAKLGRQLSDNDGTKKLGQRLLSVADDVSDAYLAFAKENLHKVSSFKRSDGGMAAFKSRDDAEAAIKRSGYKGKAIVLPFKRGQNIIIQSPTFAKENGLWAGDDDKRIGLSAEFGAELVAADKAHKSARFDVPYTFHYVAEKQARLKAMNIETPAELRAALREFIGLKEQPKAPDHIKELERSMLGRKNDGLDFFPTSPDVVRDMLDAAELEEGMSVLEPSAGWGHIADAIREEGIEPDVVELSGERRDLLEAKGHNLAGSDFMDMAKADTPDGAGYDRIVMNPPFSNRRDAEHVRHAYDLLKPGGRLVAIMGEGVFFGQDQKAKDFRDWLESVGGSSEKLPEGSFQDPSLPVTTGTNARMVVIDKPAKGMESRASDKSLSLASNVLIELADNDELFRFPVSKSGNLKTVFADVYPGAKWLGEHTRADEREETGADHRYVFLNQNGKRFYVYTTDAGRVWIDVSQFESGDWGQRVYAAVSNWAHNAGKKFQGDPAGLTTDSILRRTSAMMSSAIRFGTTKHLEAAREQAKGDPEHGIEPLKWSANDVENFRELIHTFVTTLYNQFPGLADIHYDFLKRGFFDGQNRPVTAGQFRVLAQSEDASRARAGEATLRRGVFLKSLVSSESGARPGILEQVLRSAKLLIDGGLQGLLSKTTPASAGVSVSGPAIEQLRGVIDKFRETFKGAEALNIRAVDSAKQIPEGLRPSRYAEGVFHDDLGLIYLIAENLTDAKGNFDPARALQVLMHEAVGHYGLATMMGDKFKSILDHVMRAAHATGKVDGDVYEPGHADYATVEAVRLRYPEASDDEVAQEVLARMAETDPGRTLFQYLRAMVRQWLRDVARALGVKLDVSTAELNDLVAKASGYMRAGNNLGEATESSGLVAASQRATDAPPKPGLESRRHVAGDSGRQYSAAQQQAFRNVGREVETPTLRERIASLWQDIGRKLEQGVADQFAPLKDLDPKAYLLARMSKAADGALEAMLMYGRVFLNDGVYDVDTSDGGVIDKLLRPLGAEADDFLWWVAGNRAAQLAAEGRENLMSTTDIAALKSLDSGRLDFDYPLANGKTTRDRAKAYRHAQDVLSDFNKSVLDVAEQSGLIDGSERHIWERDFYVPFYREMEGDKPNFPRVKSGLVRQKAFEKLKGGREKLNHDLLANTILNWSHLLTAAAKNRAARTALDAAEKAGAATWVPIAEKGSVFYRDGGDEHHFRVDDPLLLDAVTALEFAGFSGPAMQALGAFKRWLTMGVTANPAFKIRNLIRDSISAIGSAELSYNPLKNIGQGYKASSHDSQTYASMLASGGLIRFGTMIEGNRATHVRRLVEKGVDPDTILDGESKLKAFWNRHLRPLVDAYNEIGDRSENVNRAALYEQQRAAGKSHAEASLAARDLLDFSMGGTWSAVRFLTQTVPFTNARIQGLYKLGRAAKENPARMGYVVGAVALASLALLAAYHDDDDWKKREDWDRDNYWWFKLGDKAFRIPKPFEIGAVGTLAERSAELLFDKEMDGHRFGQRLSAMLGSTFAMNPVPQMFKPLVDLYANTDSFTGRPIESAGMERLRTEDRYSSRSSEFAKAVGKAGVLSPLQIDHLIRGYFGWLGTAATTAVDNIVRLADDNPRPAMQLRDAFLAGNFVETLPANSSRYVTQMYEQAKAIDEAYASWRNYIRTGDKQKADEVYAANKDKIDRHRALDNVRRAEAALNAETRRIENDATMSAAKKREALDRIAQQKDQLARRLQGPLGSPR